jgi:hypothetical protein
MCGPELLARAHVKCVSGNVAIDVREQIFIRRDSEAGRSSLPLDREAASHIDIREWADWAFIRLYVTVTMNSYQVATSRQNDTRPEKNNRNLLHTTLISLIMMQQRVALDSGKSVMQAILPVTDMRRQDCLRHRHSTIFSFTASTKTSST